MDGPFEYMSGLDRRGEAYTISVTLANGEKYGNLAVSKHDGKWLQVREDIGDELRPFWIRAQDVSTLEVIIL